MQKKTKALMVMGTGSSVGKSFIATGLCRLLARRGLRVAPFKAQNMSNNAAPADGPHAAAEIGRAQAVQAEAAGVRPHVHMNPLLLKPNSDTGADVIVLGQSVGAMDAQAYRGQHARFWDVVKGAYDALAADYDVIVIEGAGSPAEFNLRDTDLVNMAVAQHASAEVLLVGDIDRGGVFASLLGTLELLTAEERERIAGLVINRFRGDPALLAPALRPFEARTQIPFRGVLAMREEIVIDAEDSQQLDSTGGQRGGIVPQRLDVAVLALPTVSNFTDLQQLAACGAGVRYVHRAQELGNPDLIVLPGAKDTLAALAWLRRSGLDKVLVAAAERGLPILGICGGYQMLGRSVRDAVGHGGSSGTMEGLHLLPLSTQFIAQKETRGVVGLTSGEWLLPAGMRVQGYEIHQGRSTVEPGSAPLLTLSGGPDGAVQGQVAGTYVHGLLDREEVCEALMTALYRRRGLAGIPADLLPNAQVTRMAHYDAIADELERCLDLTGLLH